MDAQIITDNRTFTSTVNAQTNADPTEISQDMAWLMKTGGA